jgi:hypothetical protein
LINKTEKYIMKDSRTVLDLICELADNSAADLYAIPDASYDDVYFEIPLEKFEGLSGLSLEAAQELEFNEEYCGWVSWDKFSNAVCLGGAEC